MLRDAKSLKYEALKLTAEHTDDADANGRKSDRPRRCAHARAVEAVALAVKRRFLSRVAGDTPAATGLTGTIDSAAERIRSICQAGGGADGTRQTHIIGQRSNLIASSKGGSCFIKTQTAFRSP